jgi:methionyl-tRNA synthetase
LTQKTLITSALPYANGSIHLGHLVEYIQTDVYVRFLRSSGEDVLYVCGDDTHGTPIEVNARRQGLDPNEFIARIYEEHVRDFAAFGISFDHFDSTNTPDNRRYSERIFQSLVEGGHIEKRAVELTYCEQDKRFLPDRFVRGTCPKCLAPDQYGDICERCGATYAPTELVAPRCSICGSTPTRRSSEHYFFKLGHFTEFLKAWSAQPGTLDPSILNNLKSGWLGTGLADWCISRDGPYFGFEIPGETDKFFYVWLDAPIGYISSAERYLALKQGNPGNGQLAFDAYWKPDADTRIIHFIGKDILNFHALFWPAVLHGAGFKAPSKIAVHGMLSVNGEKMSKSRGTFINARQYLDLLDPAYLRFFYAANLGPSPEDLDLSLTEFRLRVNAELVNNLGNLCNRSLAILKGKLGGRVGQARNDALLAEAAAAVQKAREAFAGLDLRHAVRAIVELGEKANKFVQDQKPWETAKADPETARRDLSTVADVLYAIGAMLSPIVPTIAEAIFAQLDAAPLTFKELEDFERTPQALLAAGHEIGTPTPLIARLDAALVDRLIVVPPQPSEAALPKVEVTSAWATAPAKPAVAFDDFGKLDLRVGKILTAERVPKADKLLKLSVDLGEAAPRTIAAGIAQAFGDDPSTLVGRQVAVLANLPPRQIRGIESCGMILAAGDPKTGLSLLGIDEAIAPGTPIG